MSVICGDGYTVIDTQSIQSGEVPPESVLDLTKNHLWLQSELSATMGALTNECEKSAQLQKFADDFKTKWQFAENRWRSVTAENRILEDGLSATKRNEDGLFTKLVAMTAERDKAIADLKKLQTSMAAKFMQQIGASPKKAIAPKKGKS